MKRLIEKLRVGKKSSRKKYQRVNWESATHRLIQVQNVVDSTEAYRLIAKDLSGVKYVAQREPNLDEVMKDWGLVTSEFRLLEKKDDMNVQAFTTFIGEGIDISHDTATNEWYASAELFNPGMDMSFTFEGQPGSNKKIAITRFYTDFNNQFQGCRLELEELDGDDE